MGATTDRRHSRVKETWLRALQAGTGSLVIAAAVVATPPARAAVPPTSPGVEHRVREARAALRIETPGADRAAAPDRLAWWGNRIGVVGVRPVVGWPNWPNWNNWHNWGNYGPGWANF
jgi:hypothetical protein